MSIDYKVLLVRAANASVRSIKPDATEDDAKPAVAMAEKILTDAKAAEKKKREDFEKTEAGKLKLEIAKYSGFARLATAHLLDILAGRAQVIADKLVVNHSTVQSRRGEKITLRDGRKIVGEIQPAAVASHLRGLLKQQKDFDFGLYNPALTGAKNATPSLLALIQLENAVKAVDDLANGEMKKAEAVAA